MLTQGRHAKPVPRMGSLRVSKPREPKPVVDQLPRPDAHREPVEPAAVARPEVSTTRELLNLLIKIGAIAAVLVLTFTFVYGLERNTDPGMTPAVKDGDLVMFYRLDKDYAVGDLLLVDFQGESQVRRVVAKAGDTVDISDGGLIVNGALQQEPNIYEQSRRYADGVSFPLTVGPGQVFVLGDARENASDSRVYGPLDAKDTGGTVIVIVRGRGL